MTLGVILGRPGVDAARVLSLRLGAATVTVDSTAYDPVLDERSRIDLAERSRAAHTVADLLPLLSPGAASALAALDGTAVQAVGTVWLAATIGRTSVTGWRGVLDESGAAVPFSADAWQLACFSVPGFARAFMHAWLEPRMIEAAAGNA